MATVADRLREAMPGDAEALARIVIDGVADYPAFAPPGWSAPSLTDEVAHLHELLTAGGAWCLLAESGGEVVGHVTVLPAPLAPRPVDAPALAHLSNLFVRRDRWGGGLAARLLDAAVDHAREQGFTAMRLFVATGQARARRFYEREGWGPVGEAFHEAALGLTLVEYRRGVG
jgi:GNAT superfamily N-acetyltransferase